MPSQPLNTTRVRRTLAEHKKIVNEARTRRKLKEKENKQMIDMNGFGVMHMNQTNLLMGVPNAVPLGLLNHNANGGHHSSNTAIVYAIVVDIDKTTKHEAVLDAVLVGDVQ
jgi:hypothetical protein